MSDFTLPPSLRSRRGEVRRVGVELEFNGMPLSEAAEAVATTFGGEIHQEHEHRYTVRTALGEFEVTFDASVLRERKYEEALDRLGIPLRDKLKGVVGSVVRKVGNSFLPLEISTPAIPVTRMEELSRLEQALRAHRAEGTRAGILYAFALHFNPEAVDAGDPGCLTRTLRAFLLLYAWLFRRAEVDWFRRLLPFIDPFPERFARLVIRPDYAPDMARLTADYLRDNPTRNRPLDMLPLLAWNDRTLMERPPLVGVKVTPRPTFHYRLPNSLIDDPDWSIAQEWSQWVLIERLAESPDMLDELGRVYLSWDGSLLDYLNDRWVQYLEDEWVSRLRTQPEPRGEVAVAEGDGP